jgi:hypothetical protein
VSHLERDGNHAPERNNRAIKELSGGRNAYPKARQKDSPHLCFSDASFANKEDMSSQMGYIAFLIDGENRCATLSFKSVKCKRVTALC